MDIPTLHETLRAVKVTAPNAQWDTDDDGNVVLLLHEPLEVN